MLQQGDDSSVAHPSESVDPGTVYSERLVSKKTVVIFYFCYTTYKVYKEKRVYTLYHIDQMIKQDIVWLILNCQKYVKKAQFQKRTWLATLSPAFLYFHVLGDPALDAPYRFDVDSHTLWVKVEDDYNSLPKKSIRAFRAVRETYDVHYLFKTDDDQILVRPQFPLLVKTMLDEKKKQGRPSHYGGGVVEVSQPYLSQYFRIHPELPQHLPILRTTYCTGRFYFLSAPALACVLAKQPLIEAEYLEDYAIGYHLDDRFKTNLFALKTTLAFTDIERSDFPQWIQEGKL